MKEKEKKYELWQLEMYRDEMGDWVENDKTRIGTVGVPVEANGYPTHRSIIDTLASVVLADPITGRTYTPLLTRDMRRVFAEDYYGDGSRWEVGSVAEGRKPVFALFPVDGGAE